MADWGQQVGELEAARASGDPARAAAAEIKYEHRDWSGWPGVCVSRCDEPWPCGPYRSADALEAVALLHAPEPWYVAAADCEHPEPAGDMPDEWGDWDDTHPPGTGDAGRICKLTQAGSFCRECTRLEFGSAEPEGEDFVSAPCATRSAILAALTGEDKSDG